MKLIKKVLSLHSKLKGKLETVPKIFPDNREILSLIYTPGVAEVCKQIVQNKNDLWKYTIKANTVAIICDGSAVLGLGSAGAAAALPVIEGKALLLKAFAGVNAFPLCIDISIFKNKNVNYKIKKICEIVKLLAVNFGAIMLEDIKAPECVKIEDKLNSELDIPVFHDDQHGTAIVVVAALLNSLKLVRKSLRTIKIVCLGIGAAGSAIIKLLFYLGARNILAVDKLGIISKDFKTHLNEIHKQISKITNFKNINGELRIALQEAEVFIGTSAGGLLTKELIKNMKSKAIVFALANPKPEIMPDEAKLGGAYIIATGRSDFPNQINNLLCFPGIFKGLLNNRIKKITMAMKATVCCALANIISKKELNTENIIPSPFNKNVVKIIAETLAEFKNE